MTDFLAMSPQDFDQAPEGWRSLGEHGREREAVEIMLDYTEAHPDLIEPGQGIYFHIGQMYAMVGKNEKAIPWFVKSKSARDLHPMSLLYTDATLAFLQTDLTALTELATRYEGEATDLWRNNLPIIQRFVGALQKDSTDYRAAYSA